MVLKDLDSGIVSTISHYYKWCMKIIDVYHFILEYKIKKFMKIIYRGQKPFINK